MSTHTIHISTMLSHEVRDHDDYTVAAFDSEHCAQLFIAARESNLLPEEIKQLSIAVFHLKEECTKMKTGLEAKIKELESTNRGVILLQQADKERIHTLQEEVRMLQSSCEEHIRIRNELGAIIEEIRNITE